MRVTLATSRRLQTLIRCLEKKWRSVEAKLKQGLQVRKEEGEEVKEEELSSSQLVLMPIRGAVIKEEEELVVTEVKQRPKVKIKLTGLVEEEAGGHDQDQDQEGSKFEEMLGLQRRNKEEEDDEDEEDSKRENGNGGTSENVERTNMRDFEEMLGHRQLEKAEDENGDDGLELANTSIDTCEENSNDEPSRSQEDVTQSPRLERIEEEDEGGGEVVEEFLFDLSDPEGSRSPLPAEDLEEIDGMDDEEDGFKEEEEEVVKEEEEEVKEEMKGEDRKWGTDPRQGWSLSEAGTLTIGDLYCLLGGREGSCLRLDYGWKGAESLERCSDLLTRLVRLAGAARAQNRGRTSSQSSPSVSRSSSSGTVSSPVTSHRSPVARTGLLLSPVGRPMHAQAGGVSKQILLPAPLNNATNSGGSQASGARSSSPLAVPLEPEPEFRKPLAPAAPRQQGSMSAAFREQIGQYLPKFSNRRGRQNRSRAKQVVGRQLLQPLQPAPPPQILQPLLLVQEVVASPSTQQQQQNSTAASSSSLQQPNPSSTPLHQQSPTSPALPPSIKGISPVLHQSPQSPPQISIPSPRRSPSPTPSFSCLMDLSFPGWIYIFNRQIIKSTYLFRVNPKHTDQTVRELLVNVSFF